MVEVRSGRVLIGVVGRAHGVRGLVRVHCYAADPDALAGYALADDQGRRWSLSWQTDGVAALSDAAGRRVADRTEAEKLTNLRLYVDRDALPAPAEDEFYLADLVGLRAVLADGSECGTVAQVHDYGAGTSLEIARNGRAPILLPFTRACVPAVDVAAGVLTVAPPHEREVPPENMQDGEA